MKSLETGYVALLTAGGVLVSLGAVTIEKNLTAGVIEIVAAIVCYAGYRYLHE